MTRLHLSPLPCARFDDDSGIPVVGKDGFVDDAAVIALVAGPTTPRTAPEAAALALAADDMDFAGWCLHANAASQTSAATAQRPAPPLQEEPGIGQPHHGHHRWWLAGLAGALTTLLFSALLLSLSSRISSPTDSGFFVETLAKPRPAISTGNSVPKKAAPQLTDVSP